MSAPESISRIRVRIGLHLARTERRSAPLTSATIGARMAAIRSLAVE